MLTSTYSYYKEEVCDVIAYSYNILLPCCLVALLPCCLVALLPCCLVALLLGDLYHRGEATHQLPLVWP